MIIIPFDSTLRSVDWSGNVSAVSTQAITLENAEKQALIQRLYGGDSNTMKNYLKNVRTPLLRFLADNGLVILTGSSLTQYHTQYTQSFSSILGVYLVNENQVFFRRQSESDLSQVLNRSFYHEIGHAVSYQLGNLANSPTFIQLYQEGVTSIFPGNDAYSVYLT